MNRRAGLGICLVILASIPVCAQNNFCQTGGSSSQPTANAGKLVCLLPNTGFPAASDQAIAGLDAAIASQASLFPLASPASGVVYTNDPSLQIPVPSGTDSFGPIMFERGETLHRHKIYISVSYQNFQFNNMDGLNLKAFPAFYQASPTAAVEYSTRVDLKINQFAAYVTYGLTNRVELSAAIPVLNVRLADNVTCQYSTSKTAPYNCIETNGPSLATLGRFNQATGIGDVIFRGKVGLWAGERLRVAAAVDVRVPTGDQLNFLGTGAVGVRPFLAASWRGRVAPHGDFGFQWNGNSNIASINGPGDSGKIPNNVFWVAGADARVVKRLTLSGDYVGQRILSALREGQTTTQISGTTFTGIYTYSGSFNTNYASAGVKVSPVGNLLVTANVFFKLDNNGLHNRPAPLAGISYTF